jgi:hypothetical protein
MFFDFATVFFVSVECQPKYGVQRHAPVFPLQLRRIVQRRFAPLYPPLLRQIGSTSRASRRTQ